MPRFLVITNNEAATPRAISGLLRPTYSDVQVLPHALPKARGVDSGQASVERVQTLAAGVSPDTNAFPLEAAELVGGAIVSQSTTTGVQVAVPESLDPTLPEEGVTGVERAELNGDEQETWTLNEEEKIGVIQIIGQASLTWKAKAVDAPCPVCGREHTLIYASDPTVLETVHNHEALYACTDCEPGSPHDPAGMISMLTDSHIRGAVFRADPGDDETPESGVSLTMGAAFR